MNIYEEKINILRNEINKIKISRDKRAKNINTFLWLLLIAIDVLLYIKIKDISLFTKYQNTLLEILRYVITGCSCLIVDATLYTIGDIYNFKLYEKDENRIKEIDKEGSVDIIDSCVARISEKWFIIKRNSNRF